MTVAVIIGPSPPPSRHPGRKRFRAVPNECTPALSAQVPSEHERSTAKETDVRCGVSAEALAYVEGQRARHDWSVLLNNAAKRGQPQLTPVMAGQAAPTDASGWTRSSIQTQCVTIMCSATPSPPPVPTDNR